MAHMFYLDIACPFHRHTSRRARVSRVHIILQCLTLLTLLSSCISVCSIGCPPGTYEFRPCTNDGDRICKECTHCEGSMYEQRPCGGTLDRQCIHAAHPLLITDNETTVSFIEELKVEASDNVFLENLHATRSLETTYYVTDTTQASDFYWIRESGLQVNIGIHNVQLIPAYEDIDHDSDNSYMLENPNNSEDKTKFSNIVQKHCRHPIPDYYSITLEISRDRITAATPGVCNSRDSTSPSCPSEYKDGDTFLHRTLNEACQLMTKGTFPEPLQPAANSIVCTQNTALLRDVFNQTYTSERPISFPPKRCRSATSRCEQCLSQNRCRMIDIFEQQCCQIDCYTLKDCKQATSPHCSNAKVECAMGDAYRYTIQPVFQNIKEEFQCHLRRKQPKVLYQMFYYIMLPDRNFQTPKEHRTVYATSQEYQSNGEFETDYLTVKHNTGIALEDEFVLVGRDIPGQSDRKNYSVFSLKQTEDFRQKKVKVHQISHNIHIASTQFRRPFDYSTSSWVRGNDCDKDVNLLKSVQKHYTADGQPVNIMMENVHEPFQYFLQSVGNPPYIRFTAPGNTSVLPWYFKDNGPRLVRDKTLKATLALTNKGRIWDIQVEGQMTGCPGYVGITINNRLDLEELFRYDLLVFCPAKFNVSFKVPNWGLDPDKTFDIRLDDAKQTYSIYLTHMVFEQGNVERSAQIAERDDTAVDTWANMLIVICIVIACSGMFSLAYVYLECTKIRMIYTNHRSYTHSHSASNGGQKSHSSCFGAHNLNQCQSAFIISYTLIRFLYSLMFTFTVFFAVLLIFIRDDLSQLNRISEFQISKQNASRQLAADIGQYGQDELFRQAKLVTSMQGACSNYIEELFTSMQDQMTNVTMTNRQQEMYGRDTSISSLMEKRFKRYLEILDQDMTNFTDEYGERLRHHLDPKWTQYRKYITDVYHNDFFQFPQLLFNESDFTAQRPHAFHRSDLVGREFDFVAFMEVEEVEAVQLWTTQFWQKYNEKYPKIPHHPVPSITLTDPQCDLPVHSQQLNGTINLDAAAHHLDATKFLAPHLPGRSVRGPTFRTTSVDEEYRFLIPSELYYPSDFSFSFDSLLQVIDLQLFKIIFMVLDIILILYRCSRTYITAKKLCHGFEDSTNVRSELEYSKDADTKASELQNLRNQLKHEDPTSGRGRGCYGEDHELDPQVADYNVTPTHQQPPRGILQPTSNNTSTMSNNDVNKKAVLTQTYQPPSWWETVLKFLGDLLKSRVVPKLLVCAVIVVFFYFVITIVTALFSIDVLVDVDGFQSFVMGLEVQVNQTNWYLSQQADHFNDITMKIYQRQMKSELLNLESMLEFFNQEQKRLVQNYVTEACAVNGDALINKQCDVNLEASSLDIPVLPCNFVPIQPQFYNAFQEHNFVEALGLDFEQYLTAARQVVINSGYSILSVVISVAIINIAGVLLFFFLKTRYKFPVHRIYISSHPPRGGVTMRAHVAALTDSEDEDHESGFKRYPTRVHVAAQDQDYARTDTLLTDFKYSETKV